MEQQELERVAEKYRADGYEVTLRPNPSGLPQFLRRFQTDMIARKGDKAVVVEIRCRRDLQTDPALMDLAAVVNSQADWRFDLVVANGNPWPDDVSEDSTEPDAGRILALADAAERLLSQGELEASCLMASSAVEASLREVARRASISLEDNTPQYVLNALTTVGILSRDEYESIQAAYRVRNTVAHGLSSADLSAEMSDSLIQTARRLLDLQLTTSDA